MEIENTLTIKLKSDDAEKFKSLLRKFIECESKVGLKNNTYTTDEFDVIKKLNEKLR